MPYIKQDVKEFMKNIGEILGNKFPEEYRNMNKYNEIKKGTKPGEMSGFFRWPRSRRNAALRIASEMGYEAGFGEPESDGFRRFDVIHPLDPSLSLFWRRLDSEAPYDRNKPEDRNLGYVNSLIEEKTRWLSQPVGSRLSSKVPYGLRKPDDGILGYVDRRLKKMTTWFSQPVGSAY